ncbi:MAG: lysophospholipid acyltransferase family protein [Prevotella sp.]|nr:lysophospholipid acyltransferase family protein [Prevotella sp.]
MGYNKERYRALKYTAYYILLGFWYVFSLIPLRMHYVFSDIIYYILYRIVKYRRRVVRRNLETSFPEKTEQEIQKIERAFYHWFCDYLVESVKLMTISKGNLKKRMVFKGTALVDEVINSGQSCAVYLGHYGNWEWITSLPLWVTPKAQCGQIYHPMENLCTDLLFLHLRQRLGAICISMQDTLRKILEYRKEEQPVVIGYISDQKPYWTNIHHWVNFLHHDTPVLTGTERIVRKVNHAVFYMDVRRIKRGYYEAEFKLITREPQKMAEYQITDIYYQMLEESIQRAPEFWLWSHNRWSRTHEEFNKQYEVIDGKVIAKSQK